MSRINLKRLITKREISSIIRDCVALSASPITLWDANSNLLLGRNRKFTRNDILFKIMVRYSGGLTEMIRLPCWLL